MLPMGNIFGSDMTKKQDALKLLDRIKRGPASLDDTTGCDRDGYEIWSESWVIPLLMRLVPQLKDVNPKNGKE